MSQRAGDFPPLFALPADRSGGSTKEAKPPTMWKCEAFEIAKAEALAVK